jgi:peptidyl-prolyl cis-trans isomerase D
VGPDADEEAVEVARKKALDVLAEARSGKDFAELARKYSDDTGSKEKGGDLDFFTRERMVKPFSDAAFAMEAGEISEPVKSPFGWHLIKVEAIQEAKEPVLTDVADEIRSKLKKDAAISLAFDRSEEIFDACYEAGNISEVATTNDLAINETGFFSENGAIEGIKERRKFAEVAFGLQEGDVSEPLELSDGYYILERIATNPAKIPELDTVQEEVKKDLTEARRDEFAKKDAGTLLNELKGGATIQEAAESLSLKAESTDFFERSGTIPGIGFEQDIQSTAFSLSEAKPYPDEVIKGRKGYYVIRFKEMKEPDAEGFEEMRSQITSSLLAQKQQRAVEEFIDHLRGNSEIVIQEGFID